MEKKAFAFLSFFYLTRVELGEKQATFNWVIRIDNH